MRPKHLAIEFRGVFGTKAAPIEEWGFTLRSTGDATGAALATVASTAVDAWTTHYKPIMPADVALTSTRAVKISAGSVTSPGGLYERNADGSYQAADTDVNVPGTGLANGLPTHVACVASLVTARQGPTGKGRIYLPAPSEALDAARRFTENKAIQVAAATVAVIQALNGVDGFGSVSVLSSKGYSSAVTGVRVGVIPDTMRSRRERREEGYILAGGI